MSNKFFLKNTNQDNEQSDRTVTVVDLTAESDDENHSHSTATNSTSPQAQEITSLRYYYTCIHDTIFITSNINVWCLRNNHCVHRPPEHSRIIPGGVPYHRYPYQGIYIKNYLQLL